MPAANSSLTISNKPKLLDQVRNAIRTRHYSIRTELAYVQWVKRFVLFHNKRHPAEMREPEIADFITHLATKRKVAASTQNQALCALLFLYREVLQFEIDDVKDIVWAKRPQRLPTVLTQGEVRKLFENLTGYGMAYGKPALWCRVASDGMSQVESAGYRLQQLPDLRQRCQGKQRSRDDVAAKSEASP